MMGACILYAYIIRQLYNFPQKMDQNVLQNSRVIMDFN